jgi:hypothetical protein
MLKERKKVSASITPESLAYLEQLVASRRAANLGEAIDLAVEEMRHARDRKRDERAEPYSAGPSAEEVAEDRATMRAMRDRNPELYFDE